MHIDAGDHVLHSPSGERWIVAYVRGDRLAWCGWPQGEAELADCTLVKKATPSERRALLLEIAGGRSDDERVSFARHRLALGID